MTREEIEYYREGIRNGIKLERKRKVQSLLYDLKLDDDEQEAVRLMIDTELEPSLFLKLSDLIEGEHYNEYPNDEMTAEWLDDWMEENTDIACPDFGYRYVNSILRYKTADDLAKLTFAYYLTLLDEQPNAYDWYDDADSYTSLMPNEAKED